MNKRKRIHLSAKGKVLAGIVLCLILAAALAACSSSGTSTEPSSNADTHQSSGTNANESSADQSPSGAAAEGDVIKIGHIGAFSGNLAALGQWDREGVDLAVEEANANGGIHGKKIEILRMDDQGNPTLAVNAANKLINEGIVAAIATPNSTSTLAVVPIFDKAQIPHFTAGQDPKITQQGSKYVFRDTASSVYFNKTLVNYLVHEMGFTKFALITNSNAYGTGERATFKQFLEENNLEPVADEVVDPNAKDFTAQLSKIKASNPEVLYVGTEDIQMGLIVKQAKALGIEAQISGGNSMATSVFVETAGAEAAEGSIFATTYISKDVSEQARTFAEKYKEKYGKYPDNHGAKAYDGMNMLIEAMRNAHPNIDGPSIREEILKLDYQGVTGHFKFDETGEGMDQLTMGIIRNGKAEVLE